MLFIAYIRKYILLHLIIAVLFAMLFFAEITVMGELFYSNGLNGVTLSDTSYSFIIDKNNFSQLKKLTEYDSGIRDISLAAGNEYFDIVCYPGGLVPERILTEEFSYAPDPGQIYLTDTIVIPGILGLNYFDLMDGNIENISINDIEYSFAGLVQIDNSYAHSSWNYSIFMCEEDFYMQLDKYDLVTISFTFTEKLDSDEIQELCRYVDSVAPASLYVKESHSSELSYVLNINSVFMWIISFLAALCFGRLIIILIINRKHEYKIFELLGAKRAWVRNSEIIYILATLTVSAAIGLSVYLVIQRFTDNLLVYTNNSLVFWGSCLLIYYTAAVTAVFVTILAERIKHRYED